MVNPPTPVLVGYWGGLVQVSVRVARSGWVRPGALAVPGDTHGLQGAGQAVGEQTGEAGRVGQVTSFGE